MEWRLLEGVAGDELQVLLKVARRRTFGRNEVVFHRGDVADSLHLIHKGHFAARVVTPLGDRVTLTVRSAGDSFGELAVLGDAGVRTATVAALDPGETFSITREDFRQLTVRHPAVNVVLVHLLGEQVRELTERLVEAHTVPAERRIVRRLGELAGLYADGSGPVVIPLTQEDLAGLAGTSRATVNQVLKAEQRRGTLELGRGRTTILDREALAGP
jgi:CRP-like cAMP-binding protein